MNTNRVKKLEQLKSLLAGEDPPPPDIFIVDANGNNRKTGLPLVLPPLKAGQWPPIVVKVIDSKKQNHGYKQA